MSELIENEDPQSYWEEDCERLEITDRPKVSKRIEISYNALEGHIFANTIRLFCHIIKRKVNITKSLKIPIHLIKPFHVTTGSGDRSCCNKVCRNTKIEIQGETIIVNLYIISMDGSMWF